MGLYSFYEKSNAWFDKSGISPFRVALSMGFRKKSKQTNKQTNKKQSVTAQWIPFSPVYFL